MPTPGLPRAVSSTCVVSLPIDDLFEPAARDVADLLERVLQLRGRIVAGAPVYFGDHALARGVQPQRDDAGKAVPIAIAPIQPFHGLELFAGQLQKTKPALLARRIQRQQALLRFGAGELGMR